METIKRIKDKYKAIRNDWSNNIRTQKTKSICESFYLKEKGKKIYVLHNGNAIYCFPVDASASEIVGKLVEIRNNAVKFELD